MQILSVAALVVATVATGITLSAVVLHLFLLAALRKRRPHPRARERIRDTLAGRPEEA